MLQVSVLFRVQGNTRYYMVVVRQVLLLSDPYPAKFYLKKMALCQPQCCNHSERKIRQYQEFYMGGASGDYQAMPISISSLQNPKQEPPQAKVPETLVAGTLLQLPSLNGWHGNKHPPLCWELILVTPMLAVDNIYSYCWLFRQGSDGISDKHLFFLDIVRKIRQVGSLVACTFFLQHLMLL